MLINQMVLGRTYVTPEPLPTGEGDLTATGTWKELLLIGLP